MNVFSVKFIGYLTDRVSGLDLAPINNPIYVKNKIKNVYIIIALWDVMVMLR